uniref:Uncharacterized protein n=1 Tax=Siphoviridae sp. ctwrX9 TaxID=2825735 RepID=A0A8S5PVR2_9CAUD|nr:MAG TPA: hypothetical protein [Siphoviridae sp. ctwrX9]
MVYRDPTPLDPNKKYTAAELAKFIMEKMYGKDTRLAMSLSLLKANEVAEWAREVAQEIIDGNFDEGELLTEIERKLNELEEQYAPDLSNLKNEIEQIGTTTITRTDDLLVSEADMPNKKIIFTRNKDKVVESVEEIKNDETIKTTYTRNNDGIIQQIDREML